VLFRREEVGRRWRGGGWEEDGSSPIERRVEEEAREKTRIKRMKEKGGKTMSSRKGRRRRGG
jgi:hypothetical protein